MKSTLMLMRKICNHSLLVKNDLNMKRKDSLIKGSSKMNLLHKLLHKFKYNNKILIFSQFTTMLNLIEEYLILQKFSFCRIDGQTTLL